MPQPKKGPRLGSNPSHQRLMLRNMARSLFEHERIQTTEAKAKMLRPFAEKLITRAKAGSVHDRREVLSAIEDRAIVHKLFDDIGPRFSARNGGYTRIVKMGPRNGDAAPMALIELVDESTAVVTSDEDGDGRKRRLRRPARKTGPAAETAAPEQAPGTDEDEAGERGATPGDADSETSQDAPEEAAGEKAPADEALAEQDDSAPEISSGPELGVTDEAEVTGDTGAQGKGSTDAGRSAGGDKQ